MRILYKFPSRSRPDKMFVCLDNIISLARHEDYIILLTLDLNDASVFNNEVINRLEGYGKKVVTIFGLSDNKVNAINKGMEYVNDWDICIVMADDMEFKVEGFDLKIIELFNKYFPDTDGFLHLPDGKVNERLPTMCIIGRKLYDYFGYLYNPIYHSVYCDNEQFDVVKILKKYIYVPVYLFTHNHYRWKLREMDDLDKINDNTEMYRIDGEIYRKRKAINFGIV